MHGDAKFGVVNGRGAVPSVFTLSLGAKGTDGSILFTRPTGTRLTPGTYAITGRDDGSDDLRALVMTGSAERAHRRVPGPVRATLTVTSDVRQRDPGQLPGRRPVGFVACDPGGRDPEIVASGGPSRRCETEPWRSGRPD